MNTRSNMVKVAVVGGEGIGPEVTAQSERVLNWFAASRGVPMTLRAAQYGVVPYLATVALYAGFRFAVVAIALPTAIPHGVWLAALSAGPTLR